MTQSNPVTTELSPAKKALLELRRRQKLASAQVETIPRVSEREALPLSFAQQRLWFLDRFYQGSCAYNVPRALRLRGGLEVSALEQALNHIVERHEILRTTFKAGSDGTPVQAIARETGLKVAMVDVSGSRQPEHEAQRLAEQEARRPFDLAHELMLRATLVRVADGDHVLILVTHHIAHDGWSRGVLYCELSALYNAFVTGRSCPLPRLAIQYADYAVWQRGWMKDELLQHQLAYWRKQLEGVSPLLALPSDRPRRNVQTFQGAKLFSSFPAPLGKRFKDLARQQGVTLFMALLAAFKVFLHRYSGQHDIAIGTPVAGRSRPEIEPLIGDFVNMLVLRTDVSGDPAFLEVLHRVRETALAAYDNQDVPFEKLVEELEQGRDLSRAPLFQVMFILENDQARAPELAGLGVELLNVDTGVAKSDLIVSLKEDGEAFKLKVEYSADLFDAGTIVRFMGHFENLLQAIVQHPERRISEFQFLPEAELHRLLSEWNATAVEHPRDLCIHELFEAVVRKFPQQTALTFEDRRFTYSELNIRANQLAHYLRKQKVGPERLVGICVERSWEMVVGLLGIMKAGGTYVPLDPSYPAERIAFMMQDANLMLLLTQESLVDRLPVHDAHAICLDRDWPTIATESSQNVESGVHPDNLSYLIFTSGSTGRPKGVQLEHRNVVNFVSSMQQRPGLSQRDTYLGVASMSFDASVMDFYFPLAAGATLALVDRDTTLDGRALARAMQRHGITAMHATPSTWRMLIDAGWQGSRNFSVFTGGEALPWEVATELLKRSGAVWNLYGPTETAVYSAIHPVQAADGSVLVGRPIANTQIYIVDAHLQPVPLGASGELCIGGAGVARGYRNREELTAEKFVRDPFSAKPNAHLYRTGDIARYHANGTIECLGRVDHQLKIRGFRIELGEIESVLAAHSTVRQAVVTARADSPGDKRLVAYVVEEPGKIFSVAEARRFLKEKLPDYMVPSQFVSVAAMPLSPNGKIDRRSLPAPDGIANTDGDLVAPQTPLEQALAEIWLSVLRLQHVSVHADFFELGGHSLLATQLVSRIRDAFALELSPRVIFEAPTIAQLALRLGAMLAHRMEGEDIEAWLREA